METKINKQYIYIVQASKELSKCKIGKTNDLDRRLKEYNNITGKSKDNVFQYLFTCEVSDMKAVENAVKEQYRYLRETKNKEIYFFNIDLYAIYVKFIKSLPQFVKELPLFINEPRVEFVIVEKTTPSLKERGITSKDVLQKAQRIKNDEFYTRLEDIEKEISMYDKEIWTDKCVFCNCDDAVDNHIEHDQRTTSAFALYFMKNFKELGLKKLICTHYGGGWDIFNQGARSYVFTFVFTRDGYQELKDYPNGYTGSFDDPLSLKILNEEADIVCTNPPFSRAADYWKVLIKSEKKFLIISNITNPITPAFISYFKNRQVWAGYNRVDYYLNYRRELVDAAGHWYTNLPISNRPKYELLKIIPLKDIPEDCKKYDDSKTLIVDNGYIPNNVKTPFAISAHPILNGILEKGYEIISDKQYFPYINEKKGFARVLVQKV
ncbi:hypothetical protein FACS189429_2480 [Bacteroidia bacterium]|nr:hypothetical protein FACS189429_2480 [Bacteroidia bacterium]